MYSIIYYFYCLIGSPAVMVYLLAERLSQIASLFLSRRLMKNRDNMIVRKIHEQDFNLMMEINDKYDINIQSD